MCNNFQRHVEQHDGASQPTAAGSLLADGWMQPTVVDTTIPWGNLAGIKQLGQSLRAYEDRGQAALAARPLESLLALVGGGALVYYLAERQHNPKVQNYCDALEYVATCASVGYSNIFPETPVGKLVASALFVLGPTLTARALDPPQPAAKK